MVRKTSVVKNIERENRVSLKNYTFCKNFSKAQEFLKKNMIPGH